MKSVLQLKVICVSAHSRETDQYERCIAMHSITAAYAMAAPWDYAVVKP